MSCIKTFQRNILIGRVYYNTCLIWTNDNDTTQDFHLCQNFIFLDVILLLKRPTEGSAQSHSLSSALKVEIRMCWRKTFLLLFVESLCWLRAAADLSMTVFLTEKLF